MKLTTLRYIDRKIGSLSCYILYLVKKFFLIKKNKPQKENTKKILCIKFFGIGSVIILSLIFERLRKEFPDAQIDFLTKSENINIYPEGKYPNPYFFDNVIGLKIEGLYRTLINIFQMWWRIRQERYDIVFDFEVASRFSAITSFISASNYSIGFHIIGQYKDKLYDTTATYHESKHIVDLFYMLLECIGIERGIGYKQTPPYFTDDDVKVVQELLYRESIDKFIILNPNASDLALERRLPAEYFAKISDTLSDREIAHIWIGSLNERRYVEEVISFKGNKKYSYNFAGEVTLRQLFALISLSDRVVTCDSGPLHIATSLDRPTLSFFGPETPKVYGPPSLPIHEVIFLSEVCSPCISVYRDKEINCQYKQRCLKNINIEEVIDKYIK